MPIPETSSGRRRKSLREEAQEHIRTAIYDGTLAPGESLSDRELQRWLGFSRTPIREALNDLERVGLVEMAPQRYTRVAQPRGEDRLRLLNALGALLAGVTRLAVAELPQRARTETIASVARLAEAAEAHDTERFGEAAWALIDHFLAICPNTILNDGIRDLVGGLSHQLRVTRRQSNVEWDRVRDGATLLITAVRDGDPVGAELAVGQVFRLPGTDRRSGGSALRSQIVDPIGPAPFGGSTAGRIGSVGSGAPHGAL